MPNIVINHSTDEKVLAELIENLRNAFAEEEQSDVVITSNKGQIMDCGIRAGDDTSLLLYEKVYSVSNKTHRPKKNRLLPDYRKIKAKNLPRKVTVEFWGRPDVEIGKLKLEAYDGFVDLWPKIPSSVVNLEGISSPYGAIYQPVYPELDQIFFEIITKVNRQIDTEVFWRPDTGRRMTFHPAQTFARWQKTNP